MKGFEIEYTSKEEDGTIFYRYKYLDCRFWFSQKPNGNIYMVHIESVEYPQIEFYADFNECGFYPSGIRVNIPRCEITKYSDFDKFNKMVCHVCNLREILQYFFEKSEHAKLYYDNHKENKK